MARSLLKALVSGTRQILAAQLVIAILAVALAGWTLGVTGGVIRERDQLKARVIQLETAMGGQGIVVPPMPATVDASAAAASAAAYPPSIGAVPRDAHGVRIVSGAQNDARASAAPNDFNPARVIAEIFTPPPPLRTLVLHARGPGAAAIAQRVASDLRDQDVNVAVDVLPEHDQRQSNYAYFDGRQSRAAAAIVSLFNDAARRAAIAPWSAQLPGVALPTQGEYTADRVDIVLPALPASAPTPAPPG
jgi:hypothetical protein